MGRARLKLAFNVWLFYWKFPGECNGSVTAEKTRAGSARGSARGQSCTFFGFVLAKKVRTDPDAAPSLTGYFGN